MVSKVGKKCATSAYKTHQVVNANFYVSSAQNAVFYYLNVGYKPKYSENNTYKNFSEKVMDVVVY